MSKSVEDGVGTRSSSLRREQLLLTLLAYCLCIAAFRGVIAYELATHGQGPQIIIGGVHVHHFVFGVALLMITLLVYRLTSGGKPRLRSFMTGVGLAMVLDETSLWLPIGPDGYWAIQNLFIVVIVGFILFWRMYLERRHASAELPSDDLEAA